MTTDFGSEPQTPNGVIVNDSWLRKIIIEELISRRSSMRNYRTNIILVGQSRSVARLYSNAILHCHGDATYKSLVDK